MKSRPILHRLAARLAHTPTSALVKSLSSELQERISTLYQLAQQSDHVFGSPLGPFHHHSRTFLVPHFVYFGPSTSDASVRLAILSGYSRDTLPGTLALLAFIRRLALNPEIGQSLHLSFFPLVDVLGVLGEEAERALVDEHWGRSRQPEIRLLENDVRRRGYQGFIRVTTTSDAAITVQARASASATGDSTDIELISSDDFDPWPVRFEATAHPAPATSGPLTIADDLPQAPFELSLALPRNWSQPSIDDAVASILKRFIVRYRGDQAYGLNL